MAATTLQGRRAMPIYPSDTIDIPNINNLITSGTITSISTTQVINSAADFVTAGVKVGDIVYNVGTASSRFATGVGLVTNVAATTLTISGTTSFNTASSIYRIFRAVQNGGNTNPGCLLNIGHTTTGTAGQVRVLTVGGDDTMFFYKYGDFIPLQVVRAFETGTTTSSYGAIIAIW